MYALSPVNLNLNASQLAGAGNLKMNNNLAKLNDNGADQVRFGKDAAPQVDVKVTPAADGQTPNVTVETVPAEAAGAHKATWTDTAYNYTIQPLKDAYNTATTAWTHPNDNTVASNMAEGAQYTIAGVVTLGAGYAAAWLAGKAYNGITNLFSKPAPKPEA